MNPLSSHPPKEEDAPPPYRIWMREEIEHSLLYKELPPALQRLVFTSDDVPTSVPGHQARPVYLLRLMRFGLRPSFSESWMQSLEAIDAWTYPDAAKLKAFQYAAVLACRRGVYAALNERSENEHATAQEISSVHAAIEERLQTYREDASIELNRSVHRTPPISTSDLTASSA